MANDQTPTQEELAGALKRLVRHRLEPHWIEEVGGVLLGLRQVRARAERGGDEVTPLIAVVDAVRDAARELPSAQRKIVEVVLTLDSAYAGMTAQQRRRVAGKEFRGGERGVSAETIRQYHEPQALGMLASVLRERELDIRLNRAPRQQVVADSSVPVPLTCFVIGPIGSRHASLGSRERQTYEDGLKLMESVIEPACARVGVTPVRADTLGIAGEITDQIFRRLRDDDIVMADLTDANPNVMYELGLRHTRSKLTIQIGEFGRLPFDVSTIRTIQFSRSPVGLINARDELIQVLEAGIAGDYNPVAATRIWSGAPTAAVAGDDTAETNVDGEGADALDDEGLFLDVMAEAEEKQEALVPALSAVGSCITSLGELAEKSTAEIQQSDAAGKGMRGRLQITTRYAQGLSTIADRFESAVDEYVVVLEAVSAGTLMLISRMEASEEDLNDGEIFGMATRQLAVVTRGNMGSLAAMLESMQQTSRFARVLKEPTSRLGSTLERFTKATSIIDDWDRRLQSLGIPVPPPDWQANMAAAPDSEGNEAPDTA